jgi:hypothetical protein
MSSKWKNRIAFVLAVAALAIAVLPRVADAAPARYVFEICDSALPAGGTAGVVFGHHPSLPFSSENTCAQPGGALFLRQGEVSPGGAIEIAVPIKPPAGGALESITITAAFCAAPPAGGYVFTPGWPTPGCFWDVRSFRLAEDFNAFFIELICIGECHAGPWVAAHYFATTVVDPVPPSLAGVDGTLLEAGVRRGRQSIGLDAHDPGGGISNLFLSVNGLPAAQPKPQSCNVVHTENASVAGTVAAQVTPCPTEASAHWTVDTGSYPFRDGANRVQVCASDFATLSDPNTTCTAVATVDVDNSCGESAVAGGEVLSAQFSGSHDDTMTVGYGKAAEVQGRLTTDAGDPVRGATLCVKAQTIAADQHLTAVGSVVTDADGGYRYELAPGPNRQVVIGYRDDAKQVARDVRYYAHVRPTLKLTPPLLRNGESVHLWGKLPGPWAGRRVVVLQASAPGSKRWITFRRATTDSQGGFRSDYRFSSTRHKTRYRFRAVVPRQAGYPWIEGHSRPAAVLVRGRGRRG